MFLPGLTLSYNLHSPGHTSVNKFSHGSLSEKSKATCAWMVHLKDVKPIQPISQLVSQSLAG